MTALKAPYIQLNPPSHRAWLLLDVDHKGAASAWDDAGLPPPTFVAVNRKNGHAQIGYALAAPVCTTAAARLAPLRYFAAIEHAYTAKAGADFAFTGPLSKNPLHPLWQLWEPANAPIYELGLLAEFVKLQTKPPPLPEGAGRNCDLFNGLRRWAYSAVRGFWRPHGEEGWREAVRKQAEALNTFAEPLGPGEVNGIARSVAKYTWRRLTPVGFREIQAERGRRGAAATIMVKRDRREQAIREAIEQLSVEGWTPSMRAVAKEVGCSISTLSESYRHLWTSAAEVFG